MADKYSDSIEEFRKEPWRLVDIAKAIAEEDITPPESVEALLKDPDRLPIKNLLAASAALWDLFASRNRHKGLAWLDSVGLLHELFPCWGGNPARREMRLKAVEQLSLGIWKEGLSDPVVSLIKETHEATIDGRLNGWSLTAIGILLAGGDTENQYFWSKMVRRNMFELGATEAEILWVEGIVTEYRRAVHLIRGEIESYPLTPQLTVTIMSTMRIASEDTPEEIERAAKRADEALKAQTSPLDK